MRYTPPEVLHNFVSASQAVDDLNNCSDRRRLCFIETRRIVTSLFECAARTSLLTCWFT